MSGDTVPHPPSAEELVQFPRFTLPSDAETGQLYRVHRRDRDVEFYGTSSLGRFDPPPGVTTFGTCYLSTSPEGAFVEVFGRQATISRGDLDDRLMSCVHVAIDIELADLTAPTVLGLYGLTGAVSAGGLETYEQCQRWAAALHDAGFGGVRYRARHDPALQATSIALFGAPGAETKTLVNIEVWEMTAGADALADHFGIRIVPPAPLV